MASELPEDLKWRADVVRRDSVMMFGRESGDWLADGWVDGARAALDHMRDENEALRLEVEDLRSAVEMLDGKPSYPWRDPGDRGRELLAAQKEDSKESKHHG